MYLFQKDVYIKNKYKYNYLFCLNLNFYNYINLFWQSHNKKPSKISLSQNYFKYKNILKIFFCSKNFRHLGLIIYWAWVFVEHRLHTMRSFKFFQSMPMRFQRTRTNCITTQKIIGFGWKIFASELKIKRRTLKARFALSKKKNKPLKKSLKLKTKKIKGPVKRTRDTKKSVWSCLMLLYLNLILFFSIFLIILYVIIDEEPFFDFTDLSVFQVLVFFIFSISLVFENLLKMLNGQNLLNDKNLFIYCFLYTSNILIYLLIIWGVFYSHHITPLTFSNIDDILIYINKLNLNIFNINLFFYFFIFLFFYFLNSLSSINVILKFYSLFFSFFLFILFTIFSIIDLVFNNISNSLFKNTLNSNSYFLNSKNSNVFSEYDYKNGFDWHLVSTYSQNLNLYNSMNLFGLFLLLSYFLIFLLIILSFIVFLMFENYNINIFLNLTYFIKTIFFNIIFIFIFIFLFFFIFNLFILLQLNILLL